MGWRFRHSFKVIPGVRLNLSKSGLSASIGGAPFTLNVGPHGAYGTASVPGTGISYRQRFLGESRTPQTTDSNFPPHLTTPPGSLPPSTPAPIHLPAPILAVSSTPIEEVRSASTELLTSQSLKEFKSLIQTAYQEHADISRELETTREERRIAFNRYTSWENGLLFKRLFKGGFAKRKAMLETADAKVAELEQQLNLTTIATHIEIDKEQAEPYFKMRDEFAALSECAVIWDIKTHQATNKFRERTTANVRLGRERVPFSLGSCDLIQWEQKVPHLRNANGGDLFLYPGFMLYRAAKQAFSFIDFHDVRCNAESVRFQEEEGVPSDSKVIGQTWAKANKDGSRDKRFVNNFQIPIALYASWILKSESGLWEEFQFSNPDRLQGFLVTWNAFARSLQSTH